ncbi:MAG: ferredoxin III, nif-specific [Oscillatoriales cyanobacterium RM2_1_1]|nr:ferredoxin III, nif-specific [Oscillatoriales cyanobacterium SM2_3_0]NJO45450.1 ferredoxin III, nif-specific [Oscillatoriales cyanobacterium RM2_1_1]
MAYLTGVTSGQKSWTPQFLQTINQATCLGCGRCFKVCGRNVMTLRGIDEAGEFVEDEDDEFERRVMTIANSDNCIGCQACIKVCPKNCHSYSPLELN